MSAKKRVIETAGTRIKARRTELKLTQQQVADAVGVRRESVVQWEKDITNTSGENLLKLADFLHVAPTWILKGGHSHVKTISYIPEEAGKSRKTQRFPAGSVLFVGKDGKPTLLGTAVQTHADLA